MGTSDVTDGAGVYSFLAPVGTPTLNLTAENGFFQDMALDPVPGVVVARAACSPMQRAMHGVD